MKFCNHAKGNQFNFNKTSLAVDLLHIALQRALKKKKINKTGVSRRSTRDEATRFVIFLWSKAQAAIFTIRNEHLKRKKKKKKKSRECK